MQDEFLALDDDRVAGIVASGIAGHDGKVVGEHVDNLALAFVAPLRADDDRSSHFAQKYTPFNRLARLRRRFKTGLAAFPGSHTLVARNKNCAVAEWLGCKSRCVPEMITCRMVDGNAVCGSGLRSRVTGLRSQTRCRLNSNA